MKYNDVRKPRHLEIGTSALSLGATLLQATYIVDMTRYQPT